MTSLQKRENAIILDFQIYLRAASNSYSMATFKRSAMQCLVLNSLPRQGLIINFPFERFGIHSQKTSRSTENTFIIMTSS